eukprot:TRINITY_DN4694_c0_g1_i4.p1 TRINITY_DN4694_c0_g1~~TRINITY_DN4694_c0_g1_i4.p1  ORF type:complete len:453 (-),score=68.37 TRINITY_DN4694_c0_g1_i4:480-1838(-)
MATQQQYSQASRELARLQRVSNRDEFLQVRCKHDQLLSERNVLQQQMADLKQEQQTLQEWTPLHMLSQSEGACNSAITQSADALPAEWVANLFFTKSSLPFIAPSLNIPAGIFAGAALSDGRSPSFGATIDSQLQPASAAADRLYHEVDCLDSSEFDSFTIVNSEGGTGHMVSSAHAEMSLHQCFLPTSKLLTRNGPVAASDLSVDMQLVTHTGMLSCISSVKKWPQRDQDIITIQHGSDSAQVTASHAVATGPHGDAVEAGELGVDVSLLLAFSPYSPEGPAAKLDVCCVSVKMHKSVISTEVVEVRLGRCTDTILLLASNQHESLQMFNSYVVLFGAARQQTLFAVAGPPGTCISITEQDPRDETRSSKSDPAHNASSARRIIRTIRPAHDENCKAACRYHFEGKCKSGVLCSRCHHPSHYEGYTRAPTHRSARKSQRSHSHSTSTSKII